MREEKEAEWLHDGEQMTSEREKNEMEREEIAGGRDEKILLHP